MKTKILFISLFFIEILFAQTKLLNEKIERNILKLKFNSSVDFSIKKQAGKSVFYVPDYQDESAAGDVSLPSNEIFISLPFVENPKLRFNVLSQKRINAIPKFNDKVEYVNEEFVYSKSKVLKNTKTDHFKIKGYLWIGDTYCLHLEVVPAVFKSNENVIELLEEFEVELNFNKQIPVSATLNKLSAGKNSLITNTSFHIKRRADKFPIPDTDSWIDYTKQYIKLGTARDGIYRITRTDLENLGVNVASVNPKTFRLFLRGKEIPVYVEGENDLSFDSNDYLEFVGVRNMGGHHRELSGYNEPYNEYLGRYTDTTVYWLTWGGDNGKRVTLSNGNEVTSFDTLKYYSQIEHYEKNNWFDFSCPSQSRRESPFWIENKTWVDGQLRGGKVISRNFILSNIYPNKIASVYAKLQDYASNVSTNAHLLGIGINNNGNVFDSTYLNKYDKIVLHGSFNSNNLKEGKNSLQVYSFPTSASLNACATDWYEIEYPRYLIPFNDSLNFSFPFLSDSIVKSIELQNVTAQNFVLWKYGKNYEKYLLSKTNGKVIFADTVSQNSKFCFIDENKILSPKYYYLKQFVNLRDSQNQADYIAITHKKFKNKVKEYCNFIPGNFNVKTILVDVDDIYDEYGYGFFNPEVIKDFLKSTHNNWKEPKPESVVLMGGATYDYYGNKYKNFSAVKERVMNYVPSFGAPVSDNWFVTWDTTGAYIPQMNIGRIPVASDEEFDWYFNKYKDYVSQEYDDWNKRYLFFSGGNENKPSEINSMKASNQYVVDNYVHPAPVGGHADHFYKTIEPPTDFGPYSSEYIQNSIDKGAVFISYLGHSGTQTWDNSITNPAQLKNNVGRYPVVSDFGCSTGRFAEPDVTSFSELFTIGSDGQALGYIGNASLGFTTTSLLMPKLFYKKILKENITTVSEAHKEAKIEMLKNYGSSGVYKLFALTNTFIGDPLLSLPIPTKPNFVIKQEGIQLESDLLTDLQDSVSTLIKYNNLGKVENDTLILLVIHQFAAEKDSVTLKRAIPDYVDSLNIKLGIKNRAGNHSVKIILDPDNKYDEISKDDNVAQVTFNVASSAIRPMLNTQLLNGIKKGIKFLNPTSKPNNETIVLEISENKDFNNSGSYEIPFDSLISYHMLKNLGNGRYWCRTKIKDEENYTTPFSFINYGKKYFLSDSLSFDKQNKYNISIENKKLRIDTTKIKFEVMSAASFDGNTALILKNGRNYIFDGTLRGYYISLFEDSTYNFVKSLLFDVHGGTEETFNNFNTFLDTVSSKYLVIFAIKDDGGYRMTTELRNKIKNFGSIYIEKLSTYSSWALIGKKGASPGTMPEAYSPQGNGPVTIDTTITFLSDKGSLLTTEIGPTGKWDKLVVSQELPSNSTIKYTPIGIKEDGTLDTLAELSLQDSVADLSFINSEIYPKLQIFADFTASDDKQSPVLKSLGIDYADIAELALNYQVVSVEHDSITQGEKNKLFFTLYNVGETDADSVSVKIKLQKPDNTSLLMNKFVTKIDSAEKKSFEFEYEIPSSYGYGDMAYEITVDEENRILEFFEDNNFYRIPFYVKKDTSTNIVSAKLDVKFDGYDILDGDYVTTTPQILFELNYSGNFPYDDTTAVTFRLDNKNIAYSEMNVDYDTINKLVSYKYEPKLDNGKHYMKVTRKPLYVGDSGENLYEKLFTVTNELKAVDIYNFPNPANEETDFTFRLTKVPESLDIKIYTVAGRLIQTIPLRSSELKADINKVHWNLTDRDGDKIANGVYLYKIILRAGDKVEHYTGKLAVVR